MKKIPSLIFLICCSLYSLAQKDLTRFYQDGNAGFKNINGTVIIEPVYDQAGKFKDGLAIVIINKKRGFINVQGHLQIKAIFEDVSDFENGIAVARLNGKYGYINTKGIWVCNPKYDEAYPLHDNRGRVKLNNLYGYVNELGEEAIPVKFAVARDFNLKMAPVQMQLDERFNYINIKGQVAHENAYDNAYTYAADGKAVVVKGNKYYYINSQGAVVEEIELNPEKEFHHE